MLRYEWSTTSNNATINDDTDGETTVTISGLSATYGSTTTSTIYVGVEVFDCEGDSDSDTITITYECTGQ